MLKRLIRIIVSATLLVIISFSYSHAVTSITLDAVDNAGYWADDLTSSYLYVKDLSDSSYYYQWRYGDPDALRWSDMASMIADLNSEGINWWLESGGDPFDNPSSPIWTSLYLEKGIYELNLGTSSSAYNYIDYWGEHSWNAYVQIWAEYGDSFNFGEWDDRQGSEAETLAYYHANVDGMTINVQQDTNLYFYINDTNSIDNAGSLTLDVAVVPEPGQVILFLTGASVLLCYSRRKQLSRYLSKART